MKRAVYLFLIALCFLQAGGLLFIYQFRQLYIQYEMSRICNANEADFIKMTLSKTEYNNARVNAREILYKGNMYDIKSKNDNGQSVELVVLLDSKEGTILKKIKALINTPGMPTNDASKPPLQLLTLVYICPDNENNLINTTSEERIFSFTALELFSIIHEIPSPPPRLA